MNSFFRISATLSVLRPSLPTEIFKNPTDSSIAVLCRTVFIFVMDFIDELKFSNVS